MYTSLRSQDNSLLFRDRDRILYNADNARSVPSDSRYGENGYPDFVSNVGNNSTIDYRRNTPLYDDSHDRSRRSRNTSRNRSRSQPAWRHSDGPNYPAPQRPRSRGHSLPRDSFYNGDPSFLDDTVRYGPQSQVPARAPQQPTSQTPVMTPVHQIHSRSFPGQGDITSDSEVFLSPAPPLPPTNNRPAFPRHSSMKPGAKQTYLTDDHDPFGQPFMTSDLSSVLPSPFSDSIARRPYQPYQREYNDPPYQNVTFNRNNSHFGPNYSRSNDGSYGDNDNTVVARQHHSPDRTMSRTLQRGDSDESTGQPYSYTRDQLLGAVDQVRRGKMPVNRGQSNLRGSRPSSSERPPQVPESAKPTIIVRDRPSRSYDGRNRYSGGDVNNSSNAGSYNNGRERSRSLGREDLTPDSVSSGIGSRNTSSQLTGSSLHSRASRLGSNLAAPDMSADSGAHLSYNPLPHRTDISGDENYEFDSHNAVESDLIEALRNYSEVNSGNEELLNAIQEGLNATGLMSELYPKPSRESRYSDSEQRFEKLRGEFKKYRQQQQRRSQSSDRDNRGSTQYNPHNDSYSSTLSSRYADGRGNHPGQYYGGRADNWSYKAGPMDSDML